MITHATVLLGEVAGVLAAVEGGLEDSEALLLNERIQELDAALNGAKAHFPRPTRHP